MKLKLIEKIEHIATNPIDKSKGGYGEALKGSLKGLHKLRFSRDYRVVYQIIQDENLMKVIVVGLRQNNSVYETAKKRKGESSPSLDVKKEISLPNTAVKSQPVQKAPIPKFNMPKEYKSKALKP